MGFLDEGTSAPPDDVGSAEFTTPSADAELEVVVEDDASHEYRATIGERVVGVIHFDRTPGGAVVLQSTYIEADLRDRGIGTAFIAHVLDERRAQHDELIVECPIVRQYIELHPEYHDLLARESEG